jgi:hypothetical protein
MSNQLACGDVMELQTTQHPAGFVGREGLVKRADRMGRHIAEHRPDALSPRIMDVREIAHTSGNVFRSAPFGDLHLVQGGSHRRRRTGSLSRLRLYSES